MNVKNMGRNSCDRNGKNHFCSFVFLILFDCKYSVFTQFTFYPDNIFHVAVLSLYLLYHNFLIFLQARKRSHSKRHMQSVHYLEAEVLGPCTRALESETVCRYVQLLYLLSAFYFKFYRRCIVLFRNTQKLCIKSKCVFMLYFTGCNQAGDERKSERLEHGEYLY